MESLCLWVSAGLFILSAALLIKISVMKKSLREIGMQLREKLSSDTNTLIGISSSDRDIRKLAADLNAALRILREERLRCRLGDKSLREAVTNISHDLRTPLTAISGYLDLLEKEGQEANPDGSPAAALPRSQARAKYIRIIRERTDAMSRLTDELMKYQTAVSEETKLQTEDVIINDVLEQGITAFYALLTENGVTPSIDICAQKVRRQLNKTALSRIFSNIISNAAKYSGGDLKIRLTETGEITFANSAKGLDAVSADRLFDRFYTVESNEKSTGLGLSIARSLTERMGGEISARYTDGELTVRLVFPALPVTGACTAPSPHTH